MNTKRILVVFGVFIILIATSCRISNLIHAGRPTQPPLVSPVPSELSTYSPTQTQSITATGQITSTPNALIHLDVPLCVGLIPGIDYDFLTKHLRSTDYVGVRVANLNELDNVPGVKRFLVITANDANNLTDVLNLAKTDHIDLVAYNLEGQLTASQLLDGEKSVGEQIKADGFPYMFGPTANNLLVDYADFAKYADYLIIQSQRLQGRSDYATTVKQLIDNIKSVNPKMIVWVQVSAVPPNDPNAPVESIIKDINSIADSVDGLLLFFNASHWNSAEQIILAMRP